MQTYLSCNHAVFPNILGVPFPRPSLQKFSAALQEEAEHRVSSQMPLLSRHLPEGKLMPLEIVNLLFAFLAAQ